MKDTFKLSSKMYQMKVSQETVSLLSHGSRNEPKERGVGGAWVAELHSKKKVVERT